MINHGMRFDALTVRIKVQVSPFAAGRIRLSPGTAWFCHPHSQQFLARSALYADV